MTENKKDHLVGILRDFATNLQNAKDALRAAVEKAEQELLDEAERGLAAEQVENHQGRVSNAHGRIEGCCFTLDTLLERSYSGYSYERFWDEYKRNGVSGDFSSVLS